MREAPPTVACPHGHASIDPVICSVCGTWLAGITRVPGTNSGTSGSTPNTAPNSAPVSPSATSPSSDPSALAGTDAGRTVPAASGAECPNCSSELDAGTHFCEVCGYDPATGTLPRAPVAQPVFLPPAAPPAPPTAASGIPDPSLVRPSRPAPLVAPAAPGPLTVVVTADRAYYDSQQVGDVQFPVGAPPRVIELPAGAATIGRRSRRLGTDPVVDLAVPPEDPAVSHTHASLLPGDEGTWTLVDHGSTNGTYLNESPEPLPANVPQMVRPGDRIYLGAWTRITLELSQSS
jgi:FHA domain